MERTFSFGGEDYLVVRKMLLKGMAYYHVLKNVKTGALIYLRCFPE